MVAASRILASLTIQQALRLVNFLQDIGIDSVSVLGFEQQVPALLRKYFKVAHRARIRRKHMQRLPSLHGIQSALRLQERHWTVKPAHIKLNVGRGH